MKIEPDPNAPDGVRYILTQDEYDAGYTHVCITGPIAGTVEMADGTLYDVTEKYIPVRTEHREEINQAILSAHRSAGRFLDAHPEG